MIKRGRGGNVKMREIQMLKRKKNAKKGENMKKSGGKGKRGGKHA